MWAHVPSIELRQVIDGLSETVRVASANLSKLSIGFGWYFVLESSFIIGLVMKKQA